MWQALVSTAGRLLNELNWTRRPGSAPAAPTSETSSQRRFQPLQRVVLTDGVGHTLFEEYAAHRNGTRGDQETGWVMLGLREATHAVVLATLPAGTECHAGVAHVRFNSSAQALGSRIVRQLDRRLTMLGVVHTHPGTLRHPSDADFRGDRPWVGQLRGKEGVFGIGTADGPSSPSPLGGEGRVRGLGQHPKPHVQCLGKLRLSWYALGHKDHRYRPLPVELTLGPDLARPLHSVWPTIEAHADRLDRLARQQARVRFDVVDGKVGPALGVTLPLAEPGEAIRVLLEGKEVAYFLVRGDDLVAADPHEARVDLAVYLLLAELAGQY